MPTYVNILYEKQRRGVLITLNRPGVLNSLSQALSRELDSVLGEAKEDPEIRAVVITGAGRAFSAGEDISNDEPETVWPYGLPEGRPLGAEFDSLRDKERARILGSQLYRWEYPKPIICAVSGWCLGAASWLALTCHLTFAADDAVFGQPQVRHGSNIDFIWVLLAGFNTAQSAAFGLGVSLIPIGIAMVLRWKGVAQRWVLTGLGLYLLAYWLLPPGVYNRIREDWKDDFSIFFLGSAQGDS